MSVKIICLVGESGSGKTTLAQALYDQYGYTTVHSYTTRPPRFSGESGHRFVSFEEFDALRDDLVAYTKFDRYEYGATRQQLIEDDMYVIDPSGALELAAHIGRDNVLIVYIKTDPAVRLKRMRLTRGEAEAQRRLAHDEETFGHFADYDIAIANNHPIERTRNIALLQFLVAYHNQKSEED